MADDDQTGPPPTDLWLALMLIGAQVPLYLLFPQLRHPWEFYAMTLPACAIQALVLWECRDWVRTRTTHVIHALILLDTLIEGTLIQVWWPSPPRKNLYCTAAFAMVVVVYRLTGRHRGDA